MVALGAGCAPPSPPPPSPAATATPLPSSTPSPTPPPATATPTPAPPALTLWEGLPPAQGEHLKRLAAAFTAAHPGVTVQVQHYDEVEELIAAAANQTIDMDLALGPASMVRGLRASGCIEPLEELLPASTFNGIAGPAMAGVREGNHLWGIPDTAGYHLLLFYNTKLLAAPPNDTTELVALTEKLTTEGRYGLVMNARDPLWLLPWLAGYGGWIVDDEARPSLDSEAMVSALRFLQRLHKAGLPDDMEYREAQETFSASRAAMLIDGEWAAATIEGQGVPWSLSRLPPVAETGRAASPLVAARYWVIASGESQEQLAAALAFLEFATLPEEQLGWTKAFGLLPTQRLALADPLIHNDPFLRVSAAQMQAGRGVPLAADLDAILRAMREPLAAVLAGKAEPEEAAKAMQAAAQQP
jgi:arabinogalactan oligomer/maltooligosaccharide transport system substrate-binding protein